jgi:ATP-dependent protease ClpP protease subunit
VLKEQLEGRKLELEVEVLEQQLEEVRLDVLRKDRERKLVESDPKARGEFLYLGSVEENKCHFLIDRLDVWSQSHPGAPVTLQINSQGGVVLDGLALYDWLRDVLSPRGHHITTVGMGMVASMGGVLLQAGDVRLMTKHCKLLVHEVQALVAGSFSKIEDDMKFNEQLQDNCLEILASRSTMGKRAIKNRWARKDWWIAADEAVKLGFADGIV